VPDDVHQRFEVALDAGVEQVEQLLVAGDLLVGLGEHEVQRVDQLGHLRAHRAGDLGDPFPGGRADLVHGLRGRGS
jgi:hypothetical protein